MKSLTTSTALHAVLLTWGLWSLSSPEKLEMGGEAVPVTLVADVSQSMIGDEKAPQTDTPAPQPTKTPAKLPMPAEHVGDNEVDLPTPPAPKAAPRESVKTAAAEEPPPPPPAPTPPPKPAPEPKPAPTPAPKPPEPTPEPDETDEPDEAEADSTPEIDPLAAEIAKAEAEKPPTPPAPPKHVPAPQAKPKPPEPVKVAEAKPEPVKEKPPTPEKAPEKAKTPDKSQSTEKSAEKAKEPKKPATQTSKEKSFDADAISALLNKQDSAGGGAKRSTQQASLGGKTQTGGTLSQSEMDALRGQISKCWNPPAGNADAGSFRVKISMQLDPSGQLQGLPTLESGGGSSVAERAAGEAAIRAVRRCAPYNLPAEKYDSWAEVTVNFDPSQMF